jgi:hypothetical protein
MLKNVYCFGTSYTEGGGFEFSDPNRIRMGGEDLLIEKDSKLVRLYDHLGIELTQFNFSWPGQLQSLVDLNNNIDNLL